MNILFAGNNSEIINRVIEKCQPKICVGIHQKDEYKLYKSYNYFFNHEDMIDGNYKSIDFYNECPPLDELIIRKMAINEVDIFKMMDRCYPQDYDSRRKIYYEHLRFWNYALDKLQIDVFSYGIFPHEVYDYIIYCLCKIKKIKFIGILYSHFKEYSYLIEDINEQCPGLIQVQDKLREIYKNNTDDEIILENDFKRYFDTYINPSNDITPFYIKNSKFSLKETDFYNRNKIKTKLFTIKKRMFFLLMLLKNIMVFDINKSKQINLRINWDDDFREKEILFDFYNRNVSSYNSKDKYIYIPLHMQPELTTSPLGGIFTDQLLMVKLLSYHLPKGYFLYVKEHPEQIKISEMYKLTRNNDFYQELLSLKNVKLISLEEDTYKLINGAVAIASVTGTAGFEGLFRGKPFLMFGNYLTKYAPGTFCVRNNVDCKLAIEKILKCNQEMITHRDLKIYFKALEKFLFLGTTVWMDYLETMEEKKKNNLLISEIIIKTIKTNI